MNPMQNSNLADDESRFVLKPVGDSALAVEFGSEIDPAVNRRVHALARALEAETHPNLIELIPTYRSLLVRYDALAADYNDVAVWVARRAVCIDTAPPNQTRVVEVPTAYGGEHGPDLDWVADYCGLLPERVVQLHSQTDYTVYMMGFTPGYPYMGKLNSALETPRLETPRAHVPAGSVGIAGLQTGIYSLDSPGGWRIIGHTALVLFDSNRASPFLFAPGDTVHFVPTT